MRALVFVLLLAGCAGIAPRLVTPGHDGDYAPAIRDLATWQALAARSGAEVLARVEVVKVLYDRDGRALYFTQSRRWPIHFDFAARFLSTPGATVEGHYAFNRRQYHDAERRFVLGAITHYLDQQAWTFELFAGDELDVATTAEAFDAIRAACFCGADLRYRPVPAAHQAHLAEVTARMPVLTTEALFGQLRYQPLELGEAWGTLRVIAPGATLDPATTSADDVVVLGTLPLELPPVAGVISDELQAPLGHVAVLAHSRGTPNMAARGAATDPRIVALDGHPVHLVVGGDDYALTAATAAEVARGRGHHPPPHRVPPRATDDRGLPTLAELDPDDLAHFGAKTTQLARVAQRGGVATPRGFGLSFAAYDRFLAASGLDRAVAALLADRGLDDDPARRRAALAALRARLLAAPVPAALTAALRARIAQVLPGSRRVRLRSSTNAEDLDGFSGAGLYESARVEAADLADVERGLREVWASVWSWDAFEERRAAGIDHARVAMAILVQESIDDDVVTGVAITGNPFFEGRPAIYVNAQAHGGSVTGAVGDEVPEQWLYYTYPTGTSLERLASSARGGDAPLVRDGEAAALAEALAALHRAFIGADVGSARALDVEFLIRADRTLVILQARPYQLRWAADRKRVDR